MTQNITALTRHPMHVSVMESFMELQQSPGEQQAAFTAMLSRILTEAFVRNDPHYNMPAFLTDEGVSIIRMEMLDTDDQTAPGTEEPIGDIMGRWHDAFANDPASQPIAISQSFALCGVFETLADMMSHPVLQQGGTLGFLDPIYEDSLILIRVKASSQSEWHLRLLDTAIAA
jgi:hypothetical protein